MPNTDAHEASESDSYRSESREVVGMESDTNDRFGVDGVDGDTTDIEFNELNDSELNT